MKLFVQSKDERRGTRKIRHTVANLCFTDDKFKNVYHSLLLANRIVLNLSQICFSNFIKTNLISGWTSPLIGANKMCALLK